jgi:dolichyl-phosphate-mannose--protein O-mannosyl transferase
MRKFLQNRDWLKWVLACGVLIVSIIVRWAIPTSPTQNLVFDEVYFVPQTESYAVNRYYYDPHPPLARMILYYGMKLFNPNAADLLNANQLQNKVDNYKTPLNLQGIRFFPKVFGSLLPPLIFLLVYEIVNWRRRKRNVQPSLAGYLIPLVVGLMVAFENMLIVESRYALLSQIMLFFMFLACYFAILYYKFRRDTEVYSRLLAFKGVALWLTTAFVVGLAVSVKWLALAIVPFVVIFMWFADFRFSQFKSIWRKIALASVNILIVAYLAFIVHLGVYFWHFNKIQHYSPAADEVTETYKDDLQNGTNNTSFWTKFMDWQRLEHKYEAGVPALDYSKSDEIGSMWITWPIMARPINYYWERDDQGVLRTIVLIGNPVVWVMGLAGIIFLSALGIGRLFGKNGFTAKHFTIVMLYFANWLPYALITRVMYLYHYMPALVVSIIAWGVVMHDFVLPRCRVIAQRLHAMWRDAELGNRLKLNVRRIAKPLWSFEGFVMAVSVISLLITMLGFYFYAPMTYMLPLNQQEFEQRVLLKEWHMKWP